MYQIEPDKIPVGTIIQHFSFGICARERVGIFTDNKMLNYPGIPSGGIDNSVDT